MNNRKPFYKRHPNLPLWLSIVALIASIVMPVIREILAKTF